MRCAFVLCDHMLASSITLPVEMLHAAADHARARQRAIPLQIDYISQQRGEPVTTRSGLPLVATAGLDDDVGYDLVILPALWRNPQPVVARLYALQPWLHRQAQGGALIGAVGTGVCLLAASGLLDERPATTHWFYLDRFAALYPRIDLKRQYLITRADNLYCAASINALADLTVHFIHQLFGSAIAGHVERHFSHEARKAYDDITYREDDSERHHDEDIIRIQLWLRQHFTQTVSLAEVAATFGMSVRNFNRRFRAATGRTPLQYLQGLRMDEARELLRNSNLTVPEVAEKVGYLDSSHFTALFRQQYHLTPQEFRKSVRSKLFSLDR